MLNRSEDEMQTLQSLSALADGELDAAATMLACAQWRSDATARATWHAYHLIGDVMRSDDLASHGAHDAGFLQALRQRLADQPAVLAPQPTATEKVDSAALNGLSVQRGTRSRWMASAAVAAGFVAVASVLVVTQGTAPFGGPTTTVAQSLPGPGGAAGVLASTSELPNPTADPAGVDSESTLVANGALVRDARLERYFAAHKQFGGSSALGVPSGFLRASTMQTPDR